MKGASTYTTPGVMEMKALQAGNDILLFSENVPKAITEIKAAIERGEISQEEIDVRVKKILKAKYWCGLHQRQHVKLKNLEADLNSVSSARINTLLAEASVTVLQNTNNTIPLKNVNNLKIAEVSIGEESANVFSSTLQHYFHLDHYGIKHDAKAAEVDSLIRQLNTYDLLIVQVNKTSYKPANNFGLGAESQRLIQELSLSGKSIMVFFSNAYLLSKIQGLEKNKVVIEAYEYNRYSQKACAEVIAGAISASGKLPVTTGTYKYGEGIDLPHPIRVQFTTPEMLGMDSVKLKAVDSIALEGIKESCYPGCQIVALKNGKVFYRKSFGNTTYEGKEAITNNSVYDLASLTKILSSSLALMDLTGRDKLDINKPLQAYLPELKGTNKGGMQVKDVLTHQAGLPAWIPFHLNLLTKDNDYKPGYFNTQLNEQFPTRVAENLFVCKNFTDSIYNIIIASKTEKKGKYVYSDLGYYFFKKIIEKETNSGLGDFVKKTFYEPMGLYSLTYQPRNIFPLSGIVPTENDTRFRKQLIRGDVHDPGAALMGGVGGHAGLFGNASDVAILMYMLLNNGAYAGQQFLKPPVVRMFTNECLFCPGNRRGLCFDKPEPDSKKESPVTAECSLESFGHSGFTGTFAWADPANGLVYVFLSNRVHPDAEKNKLAKSNIRGRIHKAFYEAVKNERAWK